MAERAFFFVSALLWLGIGTYYFIQPGILGEAAGVVATTPTGTTEIRAMYGGAQIGIGLFCAFALMRPALRRPALLMLLFVVGGLGSTRLLGAVLDSSFTSYTGMGLGFEWVTVALCAWLLTSISDSPEVTA